MNIDIFDNDLFSIQEARILSEKAKQIMEIGKINILKINLFVNMF